MEACLPTVKGAVSHGHRPSHCSRSRESDCQLQSHGVWTGSASSRRHKQPLVTYVTYFERAHISAQLLQPRNVCFPTNFHLPLVCSSLHRVRCLGCVWASIAWACHLFKYCILYLNDATSWLVSGPATPRSTAAAFHLPLGHGHRSLWWLDCLDRLHPCGSIFSGPFTPQALWPHAAHLAHPPCFPASSVGSADQAHQMCSVPDLTWSVPGGSLPPGSVRFTVIMGLSHQGSRHLMCDGSAEGWRTSMMLAGD